MCKGEPQTRRAAALMGPSQRSTPSWQKLRPSRAPKRDPSSSGKWTTAESSFVDGADDEDISLTLTSFATVQKRQDDLCSLRGPTKGRGWRYSAAPSSESRTEGTEWGGRERPRSLSRIETLWFANGGNGQRDPRNSSSRGKGPPPHGGQGCVGAGGFAAGALLARERKRQSEVTALCRVCEKKPLTSSRLPLLPPMPRGSLSLSLTLVSSWARGKPAGPATDRRDTESIMALPSIAKVRAFCLSPYHAKVPILYCTA
ncbi:hypothetical protein GQ53DRAFT_237813 [Thozetella sp. PMI_491]|nr:hypothetical protein GQ53DRAFT_237813 [Thozetella sp. PMI_491]